MNIRKTETQNLRKWKDNSRSRERYDRLMLISS
jgi:hypothetical protein